MQRRNINTRVKKIKELYFAIPHYLEDSIDLIPAHAGIIIIRPRLHRLDQSIIGYNADIIRPAEKNKAAEPLNDMDTIRLQRLGCMRIWSLKQTIRTHIKNKKSYANKN